MLIIRQAEPDDLPAMLEIYNYEVEHGVATFDLHPKSLEERRPWFEAHGGSHPLLVAEIDGHVAGYASLSAYRPHEAYRSTVELSVYVSCEYRRLGIATKLMEEILAFARRDPTIHAVVSVITGGNAASVAIHEKFGFRLSGTLIDAGYKLGSYHDVLTYELLV